MNMVRVALLLCCLLNACGMVTEQSFYEGVRGNVVRVRHDVAEKVLYTEAGHLLSNITA